MSALDQLDTWPVPHAGVIVVGPDGVLARAGRTDLALPVASVTKPLFAYAVMIALEEEAIGLDDPVGPPGSTVRHLLAHTAGYGFERTAGVLAVPGARRIYSNHGFDVLAEHLERATGIAAADYLHEAVAVPLGLSSTRLDGSAAAGVLSTVEDLAAFAAELLAPTLIQAATAAEFVAVQFPGLTGVLPGHGRYDPLDWGLGVERNFSCPGHWAGTAVSASTFGHFGASGSFLWVDPERRLAAVSLSGRPFDAWARQVWPPLCEAVVAEFGR